MDHVVYVMDGDPAVEPELDTFSLILPLPYRIAVILVLGRRIIFFHTRATTDTR